MGALVAGLLAQRHAPPPTVPYLVFPAAPAIGAVGVALVPETHQVPRSSALPPADSVHTAGGTGPLFCRF